MKILTVNDDDAYNSGVAGHKTPGMPQGKSLRGAPDAAARTLLMHFILLRSDGLAPNNSCRIQSSSGSGCAM